MLYYHLFLGSRLGFNVFNLLYLRYILLIVIIDVEGGGGGGSRRTCRTCNWNVDLEISLEKVVEFVF